MNERPTDKNLAIVSGGMDSITLLYQFKDVITCVVNFVYGSKHNERETQWAEHHAKKLGKKFIRVNLEFLGDLLKSDLLKSGGEVPDGHYEDESMKRTVVPFRNGIMLSMAVGIAESNDCQNVLIGCHAGDHAIYPDCRRDFITHINLTAMSGTYKHVGIISPFITLDKRQIGEIGKEFQVPYNETYTCYKGGEKHCGKCGACTERKEALAGFDPTEYEA